METVNNENSLWLAKSENLHSKNAGQLVSESLEGYSFVFLIVKVKYFNVGFVHFFTAKDVGKFHWSKSAPYQCTMTDEGSAPAE